MNTDEELRAEFDLYFNGSPGPSEDGIINASINISNWWLQKLQDARMAAFWSGYDAGVDKQIEKESLSPAEKEELLSNINP